MDYICQSPANKKTGDTPQSVRYDVDIQAMNRFTISGVRSCAGADGAPWLWSGDLERAFYCWPIKGSMIPLV